MIRRIPWFYAWLLLCALIFPLSSPWAAVDSEELATQIAESLKSRLTDARIQTVAISRIKQVGGNHNVGDLIDFTNVKIVRGHRLRVVDRSKLELILKEQQVQLSDFVSAEKYQELGRLMGVDLFIYGTFYKDALVLKGINVQNSAIVWADFFPMVDNPSEAATLRMLGKGMIASLNKDMERLKKARIKLISFWDLETDSTFAPNAVMDYLSIALTQDTLLRVVDRENLSLITAEQRLNQSVFIDQKNAKRLGELYGVDAFIYGGIKRRGDGSYLASLKMLNIFNGVIEWADLIKIGPEAAGLSKNSPGKGNGAPQVPGMAYVSGGMLLRGTNKGQAIASPQHRVDLPAFYIDLTEVDNASYLKFVQARRYRKPVGWQQGTFPAGKGNHPVVGVTWEDARRFCAYVGKRLPAESEWEKAARGTAGAMYPWGNNNFSPGFTITRESGRKSSVPVNTKNRDTSPYQVQHLAGNVREWVADMLASYRGAAGGNDPRYGKERVVRGGSWATNFRTTAAYHRGSSNPSLAWQDVGFRCAKSP